ncbi:MAG TPA: glycosyltransferase [Isosphaeraceae bacterium]|nr:glycosyltransferase [Isosphaeraceae bacterium]
MEIRRVAVIYDDRERPETTGVHCRRALESLVEVVHFRPDALAAIPARGFDLYLNIDDGLAYHLPAGLRPCVWWAIDTHLNFAWCREKAARFDIVLAAQRDGAARLEAEGIAPASWLPLACDPEIHRRHEVEKVHDVAFVGNLFPGPRTELIERLRRRFRSMFAGRAYFEEMARIYSAARLVFNRSIKNDVNMRVFEAVACGWLLLTNDLVDNGQAELFRDGVHLATYREAEELLDKAAYYLQHEAIRERIAAAGRAEAVDRHTYRHRMQAVLERVDYDRVHGYDAEPSRREWTRQVAPLCRVAFVTDGGLAQTDWANWRVLRQGISRPTVEQVEVPEHDRDDLAFLGQLYGPRWEELAPVRREFRINVIADVFGRGLSAVLRRHRIILGPRYPSAPGYCSDRVYVVLGHRGFFLAPEVEGMRDEGLVPGVHYAPLGDDPVREIRHWLARPEERTRIACQGQELVLGWFTYEDRVRELSATIAATLDPSGGRAAQPDRIPEVPSGGTA